MRRRPCPQLTNSDLGQQVFLVVHKRGPKVWSFAISLFKQEYDDDYESMTLERWMTMTSRQAGV